MTAFVIELDETHAQDVLQSIQYAHHEIYFSRPEIAELLTSLGLTSWATYVVPFGTKLSTLKWRGHTLRKGVGHHSIGLWAAEYCDMCVISENLVNQNRNHEILSAAKKKGRVIKCVSLG